MNLNENALSAVPEDSDRQWTVVVNGKVIEGAHHVLMYIDHPNFGRTAEYGYIDDQRGNKYPGFRYYERGGGGTVAVPYLFMEGQLWIAVVTQYRVHAGGDVENAPRGYIKAAVVGRTQNVEEEIGEEMGPVVLRLVSSFVLPGQPANMNTAVFWTPEPNEGNSFHAVEIDPYSVEMKDGAPVFRDGVIAPEGGESIIKCHFIPWYQAAIIKDALTNAGVVRLLSYLVRQNLMTISF